MHLNAEEAKIFRKLDTHIKIQDFLDTISINYEKDGETCSSPRAVLHRKSAHCIEAALLAAAILSYHGKKPLLLDLKANNRDYDHVVCLFREKNKWGAISKSNHLALRYREPVYSTPKELALSYFHEYYNSKGEKTLRSYSNPFNLTRYGIDWITSADDLWEIANDLDEVKHYPIVPKGLRLRKADQFEIHLGNLTEWSQKSGKMVKYK
ncbi:MAG: hypothetical protein KW793_01770 [Candidatus Doudnabacteria bacterium]|nr:hypothetical protein [Candidatus Doudnabacteria bacterium]